MNLKEAIELINSCKRSTSNRCNVEFISADKKRGTGGELKTLEHCFVTSASHDERENGTITVQSDNGGHPVPIHIRLLMKVNEIQVLS